MLFHHEVHRAHEEKVWFVFLPSYSHSLNLIERLWGLIKKYVLHNRYHIDIKSFRRSCIEFLSNTDPHHEKTSSLMGGRFDVWYS